jgi:hypothetical protein
LIKEGYTELEAEKLMLLVSLEALSEQRVKFVKSSFGDFIRFWNVKELPAWKSTPMKSPTNKGQVAWSSPGLVAIQSNFFKLVRWPPPWELYALAAMAAIFGGFIMLLGHESRTYGLMLLFTLGYFSVLTAILGGFPQYRYRMILEPAMIVLVAGAIPFVSRFNLLKSKE